MQFKTVIQFLVLVITVSLPSFAGIVPVGVPYRITLNPSSERIEPGNVFLEVTVKRILERESELPVTIAVETFGGLTYSGPTPRFEILNENDSLGFELEVTISSDTANGILIAVSQESQLHKGLFIMTYGDSIQVIPGFVQERFRGRPETQATH